jgi:uncharacterized repeat protein (TIGR03803 family)
MRASGIRIVASCGMLSAILLFLNLAFGQAIPLTRQVGPSTTNSFVSGSGFVTAASARAQTHKYSVLYSFTRADGDGAYPLAGLIQDVAGNLYGTTTSGGHQEGGTVFVVNRSGQEKVLHSFGAVGDGSTPFAGLVQDTAGNLYGTTAAGGAYSLGTVFVLNRSGQEKVLHSFGAVGDGSTPYAGLVRDAAGNLYGTTYSGGAFGWGTVFALTP